MQTESSTAIERLMQECRLTLENLSCIWEFGGKIQNKTINEKEAQTLLEVNRSLQENEELRKKISIKDLFFWVEQENFAQLYIFNKEVFDANLTKELIAQAKQTAQECPKEFADWCKVKQEVEEIERIPLSQYKDKKRRMEKVIEEANKLSNMWTRSRLLGTEFAKMNTKRTEYINFSKDLLKNSIRNYFSELLSKQGMINIEVVFSDREGRGVQLSQVAVVNYQKQSGEKHSIKYHVKTHQHGSTSESRSNKPVDIKELFVYKVFEFIGIGPKSHFIINPLSASGGLFIATQDASFTKIPTKQKIFLTYQQLKNVNDNILTINNPETCINLTMLDILARIFRLTDLTTNSTNFGVTIKTEEKTSNYKWKIIDFRVDSLASYQVEGILNGFLSGNGMFNYDGIMLEVLKNRQEQRKIEDANEAVCRLARSSSATSNPTKKNIFESVDLAFNLIRQIATEHSMELGINVAQSMDDLNKYKEHIKSNFNSLDNQIKSRLVQSSSSASNLWLSCM